MSYIDGFIVPVKTNRKQEYVELAKTMATLCKEYGATLLMESWGDDVPDGKVTDFKRAVAAEADETVVFSFVVWPSKEAREAGNKKMMSDPRMKMDPNGPANMKRMIWGGFSTIVEHKF